MKITLGISRQLGQMIRLNHWTHLRGGELRRIVSALDFPNFRLQFIKFGLDVAGLRLELL